MIVKTLTLLTFLFLFQSSIAQEFTFSIPDSLAKKSYWDLQSSLLSSIEKDSTKANLYAKTFLSKAFNERDSLYIAEGYLFLSSTVKDIELQNTYLDKSIHYSKNINDLLVPCVAYSIKGGLYDDKRDYKKSLDYYLLAHESAEKGGNKGLAYMMKENIGIAKSRIGDYESALKYSREAWEYVKNGDIDDSYFNSIFSMSYVNAHLKNIDSSNYYNELGYSKSKEVKNEYHKNRFIFLFGITYFFETKYTQAISNFNKSLNGFYVKKDTLSIAASYYFLGSSNDKLNNKELAKDYFIKMDSIFNKTDVLIPYCRKGYQSLIGYYKNSENIEMQLFYTNRLLRMDSIINTNYKNLSKVIYEKFETPALLKNKDVLISLLKKKDKNNINYIYILIFLVLSFSLGLVYNFFKRKKDYQKFQILISEVKNQKNTNDSITNEQIDIDENLVSNILEKLKLFEEKEEFLNPNISLTFLSKKLKTNSRYLSKIINYSHQKTFTKYINDLRVDYVVDKLKIDESFRKYSIVAIGKEIGFKTGRAFSDTFKKKTGLYPSYFIEKLSKELNSSKSID